MNDAEFGFESFVSDEVVSLLLKVARRADELMAGNENATGGRDYWTEAELEVFATGA